MGQGPALPSMEANGGYGFERGPSMPGTKRLICTISFTSLIAQCCFLTVKRG
jgi:hypothetical protein